MKTRREFIQGSTACALLAGINPGELRAQIKSRISKRIPVSGEALAVIGMGSWITFDVSPRSSRQQNCTAILQKFFDLGGGMIDSSPMYGRAEDVIGNGLAAIGNFDRLFSATKVWIPTAPAGKLQMRHCVGLWGLDTFDLIHVHNMVDWRSHLPWLQEWKSEGRLRYCGITTSHGSRHSEMETVIREQPFDFVQFTYNMDHREAEHTLLPLAADHGKAVVINRPFDGGRLFGRVRGMPLPGWAGEIDCQNWAQYFLKFIVSHPAVHCAIPATSNVSHMQENMGALYGRIPSAEMRREMLRYFESVAG